MKVKITKAVLLDNLKKVQNIVPAKGSLPILQNVKMDAKDGKITFTCSDIDNTIICNGSCEVVEEGSTTVPVKNLVQAVSVAQEGTMEISVNDKERSTFVSGNSKFSLSGLPSNEFPRLPEADGMKIEVSKKILKDMIRKTQYAASKDETRRTLKGCLFSFRDGKLTVVATDGRRLAVHEYAIENCPSEGVEMIVPVKTISEVSKNLDGDDNCTITIAGTQVLFDVGTAKIYSKLIADTYPNYRQVIPKESKLKITVDRNEFVDMLTRVSVFANDHNGSQMKFHFDNGVCSTSAAYSDVGDATDMVTIKYDGEPLDATFNPHYLLESLKAIDEDTIDIFANNGSSPIIVRKSGSEDFLYVLMPLRIG